MFFGFRKDRKIREHHYAGRHVGDTLVSGNDGRRYFESSLLEIELFDLVRDMPIRDRIHMKSSAYGVFQALSYLGHDPEDCVSDEDLGIYVLGLGCKNLSQLNRKDKAAWRLIKKRELAEEIFSDKGHIEDITEDEFVRLASSDGHTDIL